MAYANEGAYKVAMIRRAACYTTALLLIACLEPISELRAGGGPENVFLVFNTASEDSRALAEHYRGLRRVPAGNVFGIEWRRSRSSIPVQRFRDELLTPILKEIDRRKLSAQIDYVVYSCDFPWRIELKKDFDGVKQTPSTYPYASLTGATYLYQFIQAKSQATIGLRTNWYVPGGGRNLLACRQVASTPSRAFSARRLWRPDDAQQPTKSDQSPPGLRYLLSTMLAVTDSRGNTLPEAKRYLKGAALADSVPPDGTFYFVRNGTPRSKPRHQCFDAVAAALRALGARVEVRNGDFPSKINDALGVVTGTPNFSLAESRVRMMPGSIGDNLTSHGGVMNSKSQTKLSEFLRHGAAGASGTVFEPTALQAKFALPTLLLHYRRGCSLAEAYYQSVASPYQLLIVGDPLCQPWADRPRVSLPGFQDGQALTDSVVLRPKMESPAGPPARAWDLYVDGRRVSRAPANAGVRFDPRGLKPGLHEVRIIAIGGGPIEPQGRWISSFVVPPKTAIGSESAAGAADAADRVPKATGPVESGTPAADPRSLPAGSEP